MAQVDVDAVIAKLKVHAERLKQIRRMPLRSDTPELLAILESLAATEVTAEGLRASRIGLEVNNPVLRQHECRDVRSASTELVLRWKASVLAEKDRITVLKPSVVDDDVSTVAATQSPPTSVSSCGSPPITASSSTPPAEPVLPTRLPPGATMGDTEFIARFWVQTNKAQRRERRPKPRRQQRREAHVAKSKPAKLSAANLAAHTRLRRKPTTKKRLKHS